ncbi:M20/M25/M40 family metallo-hydrolase [Clostridium sp.]|jgi:arginine utilization protein RocB|uniref:M20/M25/M40 family metallo-hydrolase n=1 Tax=Clostridium sp. TaxID=1506 RepID=UPI003DA9FA46
MMELLETNLISKEIEDLTIDLVKVPSVNGTKGEVDISNKIYNYIKSIDYFKINEDYVWQTELKNDRLGRKNVFAFLRGEKKRSGKTIILHGHMDTVGVDDFGQLSEYAFNPVEFERQLKNLDLPNDVRKDLDSGKWLFGRGASDMKSGDAVHLIVLKELSKKIKDIEGNILFMSNPVEENEHTGIIEALDVLEDLKEKYNLEYSLAINNDYICPMYEGDTAKYIYTGTVGKLLPCFYIFGKETHVGQCFEGLNPDVLAGQLINEIDLNVELCDEYSGEYTLPPSVLKFKDLKKLYNVQTPSSAFVYFNYAVHNESPEKTMAKLKKSAVEVFDKIVSRNDKSYRAYCEKVNQKYTPIDFQPSILTYSELCKIVEKNFDGNLKKELAKYTENLLEMNMDLRIISLKMVEKVFKLYENKEPCIVLFFAAPYCPHNVLKDEDVTEREVIEKIEESIDEMGKDGCMESFKMMKFFPSLSDSSYLKIDDDFEELYKLTSNFPGWGQVYEVPLQKIKKLNIPIVNYGCYGKDAHKWTERVYKPYSFEVLPKLILKTVDKFLNC